MLSLQYTDAAPGGPLNVIVFAGADAEMTLVEDDGSTTAYEAGAVRTTTFKWTDATKTLSWTVSGSFKVRRADVGERSREWDTLDRLIACPRDSLPKGRAHVCAGRGHGHVSVGRAESHDAEAHRHLRLHVVCVNSVRRPWWIEKKAGGATF